jgi:TPR repeat protein
MRCRGVFLLGFLCRFFPWQEVLGAKSSKDGAGIQLNITSSPSSCVFDRVALDWHVPYESFLKQHCDDPVNGPQVCVYEKDSGHCVTHFSLCTKDVSDLMAAEAMVYRKPEPRQVVWCKLDQDLCSEPSVSNAIATGFFGELDDDSDTTLTITFNQATNTPNISTKEGVDNVFIFSRNIGANYSGVWLDETNLKVTVTNQTGAAPREELSIGKLQVRLRKKIFELSKEEKDQKIFELNKTKATVGKKDSVSVRLGEDGPYDVRVVAKQYGRTSSSNVFAKSNSSINVKLCDDVIVEKANEDISFDMTGADKYYSVDGVLSMDGTRGLTLPREVLPRNGEKSWSFSMWVYLMEDSTGKHRSLIFKGPNPSDGHRTPSIWLMPHSRHLSVRVSSNENTDMGQESRSELPVRVWTHLTFVFRNHSQSAPSESAALEKALLLTDIVAPSSERLYPGHKTIKYEIDVFINGKIDITLKFKQNIVANNGFLHVGKDPWFAGTRSMMANIRIFDMPLSKNDVRLEMQHAKKDLEAKYDGAFFYVFSVTSGPKDSKDLSVQNNLGAKPRPGGRASLNKMGKEMQLVIGQADVDAVSLYEEAKLLVLECRELHRAVELLEAAGRLNHAESLYFAASLLLHGPSAHAAEDGDCSELSMAALFGRATVLEDGIERLKQKSGTDEEAVLKKPTTARAYELLLKAAKLGSGDALWMLGVMHASGLGVGGGEILHVQSNGLQFSLNKSHQSFSIGLYHLAALHGNTNAQLALGHRYHRGIGVEQNCEAAAFYYSGVADKAIEEHQSGGAEQIHEQKRLTLETEEHIDEGELGESDQRIKLHRLQAEQGNVDSMLALGNLYYYGGRGLPRDQVQALRYFRMAGSAPNFHASGQMGVANMLLKGEGTEKNTTAAVEWYEKSAAQNHTRALNGLGYLYFFGNSLPKNDTKAFEYFNRAAKKGTDGDSLFNAGFCLYDGTGTKKDVPAAIALFKRAGRDFGHFPAVHKMGGISLRGEDAGGRVCSAALEYLRPSAQHGSWGNVVRRGFNRFLSNDPTRAAIRYLEGAELGYEVAQSNAAYIFDRGYINEAEFAGRQQDRAVATVTTQRADREKKVNGDKLALRLYLMARKEGNKEHDLRIGDFYYYGKGGISKNFTMAATYYRQASAYGVAQAAYSLGTMYEKGEINAGGKEVLPCDGRAGGECISDNDDSARGTGAAERALAKKYFQRTLELNPAPEVEVVINLALQRMSWREWTDKFFDPSRPWVTPAMENVFIAISVLLLSFLYGMSQNFFIQHSLRVDEIAPVPEHEAEMVESSSTEPDTYPLPSSTGEDKEVRKECLASDIVDGIPISQDIVNTYSLMAQHINMLREYRRFCAASLIQQWYRRSHKKNAKSSRLSLCYKEKFLETPQKRHEAFQKRKHRMLADARKNYLRRRE